MKGLVISQSYLQWINIKLESKASFFFCESNSKSQGHCQLVVFLICQMSKK